MMQFQYNIANTKLILAVTFEQFLVTATDLITKLNELHLNTAQRNFFHTAQIHCFNTNALKNPVLTNGHQNPLKLPFPLDPVSYTHLTLPTILRV